MDVDLCVVSLAHVSHYALVRAVRYLLVVVRHVADTAVLRSRGLDLYRSPGGREAGYSLRPRV